VICALFGVIPKNDAAAADGQKILCVF